MEKSKPSTSVKRDQIVAAASKLFLRDGYKATSMDAIVKEAAVSKPTLYNHFQNKEQLFTKIACGMCNNYCENHCTPEKGSQAESVTTPEMVLNKVGQAFLRQMILKSEGRAMLRMALAESPQFPELGKTLWDTGLNRLTHFLSGHLERFHREKILYVPNPEHAAKQFIGLVSGPYLLPVLLGIQKAPDKQDVDDIIDQAITVFVRGYQPTATLR